MAREYFNLSQAQAASVVARMRADPGLRGPLRYGASTVERGADGVITVVGPAPLALFPRDHYDVFRSLEEMARRHGLVR